VVLVPFSPRLPVARADMPRTDEDRARLMASFRGPYGRAARPGDMVAIICVTEDRRDAELASDHLASGLQEVGINAPLRLWATDDRWVEFNSGQAGIRTQEAAARIAAEAVVSRSRKDCQPSRGQL
jgi:hypothetical protein